MTSPGTPSEGRLDRLTKLLLGLAAVIGAVGAVDQALAKLFNRDSVLFSATGVGLSEQVSPPGEVNQPAAVQTPVPATQAGGAAAQTTAATTAATGQTSTDSTEAPLPQRFTKPKGEFYLDNGLWKETGDGAVIVVWQQVAVRKGQILLYDPGREMYLRLPISGGIATWSKTNPISWIDLFDVEPVAGSHTANASGH